MGDERVRVSTRDALDDAEVAFAHRLQPIALDALDNGQRRRLARQTGEEALDGTGLTVDLEQDTALVVEHESAELLLAREPVDERTKADSLYDALHPRTHARGGHGSSSSTSSRRRCEAVA